MFPSSIILVAFSLSFVPAWNFYFPSYAELILWRIVSVYHACFGLYDGLYYLLEVLRWHRERKHEADRAAAPKVATDPSTTEQTCTIPRSGIEEPTEIAAPTKQTTATIATTSHLDLKSNQAETKGRQRLRSVFALLSRRLERYAAWWRNLSADDDPNTTIRLRLVMPITMTCILYIWCRLYIYVEDFNSLKEQPVGVFQTVNRFIPFLGD